jgi:four helix bundle protein
MAITSYKDLEVWKKAVELVTQIYLQSKKFPLEENFGLTSQIRRAAVSIPANMAEGWGRQTTKEYIQSLRISRGPLLELETEMLIAFNLNYIDKSDFTAINERISEISKMLNSLISKLEAKV